MMENKRRVSRETLVVGGLAIFILVVGVVAYGVMVMTAEPEALDEQMWFRITSEEVDGIPLNSTLSMITISSADGDFYETMIYNTAGQWQGSCTLFDIGDVIHFVVFFFENSEYYDATYRIGRGPVSVDVENYVIDFISYWELPDY